MKLCCFFNYAPHYRRDIFMALDAIRDCRFWFGREVEGMRHSGIEKMDVSLLRARAGEFDNVKIGRFLWRRKLLRLAFKRFDAYLLTADLCLTYVPFIILAHLMGKRVYAWGHGIKELKGVARGVQRFLYRHYDGLFIYSDGARRRMIELGFDPARIHVIHNSLGSGADTSHDASWAKWNGLREHFGNGDAVLLFSGRLTGVKRLDMLLEAVSRLNAAGKNCNLVIVGDGPERGRLEDMALRAGIASRVWFYGACYDDESLGRLFYNCSACVSPGNVGLTALHAMEHGLPVVSHNDFETQMPEYEVIEPGVSGELFDEGDVDSLVGALGRVLSYPDRETTRRACRGVVDRDWNTCWQTRVFDRYLR